MNDPSFFLRLIDRCNQTTRGRCLNDAVGHVGTGHLKTLVQELRETDRGQQALGRLRHLHTGFTDIGKPDRADREAATYFLRLYRFDRQLRLLVWEALKSIETLLRSRMAEVLVQHHGRAWPADATIYDTYQQRKHRASGYNGDSVDVRLERNLSRAGMRRQNMTVPLTRHLLSKFTFGSLVRYYGILNDTLRHEIADTWGCAPGTLQNWLLSLNVLRNLVAHHQHLITARFQDKENKKEDSKKYSDWFRPLQVPSRDKEKNPLVLELYGPSNNNTLFALLAVVCFLRRPYASQPTLRRKIRALLCDHVAFQPLVEPPKAWEHMTVFT